MMAGLMLLSGTAFAQAQDSTQKVQELERRVAALKKILTDWGGLTRYGSENTELPPLKSGENRATRSPRIGAAATRNSSPANRISIAGSPARRLRKCWCGSTRTWFR